MLSMMIAMWASFLPEVWRQRWHGRPVELARGALVSGLLQLALCVVLLVWRYFEFMNAKFGAYASALKDAPDAMNSTAVRYGMGLITFGEYVLHPVTLVLIYFAFEGAVRFGAALIQDEVVGSMPLHVAALVQQRISKAAAERAMGPRIVDEVQEGDGNICELRILSCRAKPAWDHLITISYNDQLYEVAGNEQGPPPRPYVYLLRRTPSEKVIRGIERFEPERVLETE